MLNIFMLSGSIWLYSQIQFNIRHTFILNHTFYFIHDQCKTILMLIQFHILSLYGSLIFYKYAFSYATNHSTIQFMRFKHTLIKMCLVYKSHFCFTYQSLLYHYFDYTIYIHDRFTIMTDADWCIPFPHVFTLQIIDHIKICIFTCFHFI